jgi:hypothetical protein
VPGAVYIEGDSSFVTTGLDPVVHADLPYLDGSKGSNDAAWIAGSSPAMTTE